ncbi:hypothetical protein [Streptomyces sp. NPDC088847]|uniref:hypothetical protein n=1 Tax=Streptomyces sp. NPDC088847 TaxID=3365909 RepID=UPI0037F96AFB
MNIGHKEILAVYRKNSEELSYQVICMRLAIEQLEATNQDLERQLAAAKSTTDDSE